MSPLIRSEVGSSNLGEFGVRICLLEAICVQDILGSSVLGRVR